MPESLTQHGFRQSMNSQVYSKIPHLEASQERLGGGDILLLLRSLTSGTLSPPTPAGFMFVLWTMRSL